MEIESAADFVRMTRGALSAAGFVRHEEGGQVWFTGGQATLPVLVLLHGANDHAGTWFTIAPALAQRFHVLVPDLPGHGESAPRGGAIPVSAVVARLESLIPDDAIVVGNSFGGWMALHHALRRRVQRLVLEASGGLARPLAVPLVATSREQAAMILRAVHGPRFVAPEWVTQSLLDRASDSPMLRLTEVREHDIEQRLGDIDVPVDLIWGADDGVLPLDYARALHSAIPNARLHVIEGAAHIPHMQQPQKVLECLTAIF